MKIYEIKGPGAQPVEFDSQDEIVLGAVMPSRGGGGQVIIPITHSEEGGGYRPLKTAHGLVLVKGPGAEGEGGDDPRAMVIIDTTSEYSRSCSYGIKDAEGVTVLAEGRNTYGPHGTLGGAAHLLAIVEAGGSSFRMRGKYGPSVWYTFLPDQTWRVEKEMERAARLALEAAGRGEGEWL